MRGAALTHTFKVNKFFTLKYSFTFTVSVGIKQIRFLLTLAVLYSFGAAFFI